MRDGRGSSREPEASAGAAALALEAAERHPHIADLDVRSVYAGAWHLYRREPVRVAVAAIVLLAPGLILGIGTGAFLDRITDDTLTDRVVIALAVAVLGTIVATLGTVFYAGVLDELVGSVIRGEPPPGIRAALRVLPIWRLIAADLVVSLAVGVAASFFVVPAFVLLSMLATIGPIINIERRGVFSSIRRAFALTGPHLWLTLAAIGAPLALEIGLDHYLLHLDGALGVVAEFLVTLPLILTVGVIVGLNEVVLTYALPARHPHSTVAAMVRDSVDDAAGSRRTTTA